MIEIDRKERDRQLRKSDILRAAEYLFATKGYHEATIQDIAKKAQYGAGTVYLYFKDKDDLYFSLLEEKIKGMIDIIKEKTEQIKDARKKLEMFIHESFVFFEKNKDFFRIYSSERNSIQRVMDKSNIEASSAVEYGKEYVAAIIKMAQGQNVIIKESNPYDLADILISIMGSAFAASTMSKKGARDTNKADFVCNVFLRGVEKR